MKKTQQQINTVLNPTTQNAKLCLEQFLPLTPVYATVNSILNDKTIYIQDKAMIELLFISGLRISEALNIKYGSITKDGRIAVKGMKGSNDRLVFPSTTSSYFQLCKLSKYDPFKEKNRFYYYRFLKQKGLYFFSNSGKKNAVTHVFRHNFVSDLANSGADNNFIKTAIGHKSIKSTEHYVEKNKKQN